MQLQRVTLAKKVLQWGWMRFILLSLMSFLAIIVTFFPLYSCLEPKVRSISDAIFVSLFVPLGMGPSVEFSSVGRFLVVAEGLLSIVWFAVLTAFIVARISNPRNNAHLTPIVGLWREQSEGDSNIQTQRHQLEFRLVVYPSPPLIAPEISVSYYHRNDLGERETIPLELVPVQAAIVRYYLGFCAIVPSKLLIGDTRENFKGNLVQGTVDVLVKAIDSQSDVSLNILRQYSIPADVREGSFKDAIILDKNGSITGIREENLYLVIPWIG